MLEAIFRAISADMGTEMLGMDLTCAKVQISADKREDSR